MNLLVLKIVNGDYIVYEYQPEGKGKSGLIKYNKSLGVADVDEVAENDADLYYANKAMIKVKNFVANNNLPMQYTQAWY